MNPSRNGWPSDVETVKYNENNKVTTQKSMKQLRKLIQLCYRGAGHARNWALHKRGSAISRNASLLRLIFWGSLDYKNIHPVKILRCQSRMSRDGLGGITGRVCGSLQVTGNHGSTKLIRMEWLRSNYLRSTEYMTSRIYGGRARGVCINDPRCIFDPSASTIIVSTYRYNTSMPPPSRIKECRAYAKIIKAM